MDAKKTKVFRESSPKTHVFCENSPKTHVFSENLPKSLQKGEKFVKKDAKNSKNSPFFVQYNFSKSDSYLTIGSPMLLVR